MEPVVVPIAEKVPILPQDTERLVQINGAVMVGAGARSWHWASSGGWLLSP
jgi:hypothetical protein